MKWQSMCKAIEIQSVTYELRRVEEEEEVHILADDGLDDPPVRDEPPRQQPRRPTLAKRRGSIRGRKRRAAIRPRVRPEPAIPLSMSEPMGPPEAADASDTG
jgi:hypothetical protein